MLVISCDAIVMRAGALRPATAQAAQRASPKLKTLSPEARSTTASGSPRSAPLHATPTTRTAARLASTKQTRYRTQGQAQVAIASVVDNAAAVVSNVFEEAEWRYPTHQRTCRAVDANNHQIYRIKAEAKQHSDDHRLSCSRAGVQ